MDFTPIVNKLSVYKLNCRHLKNAIDQKKKKKKPQRSSVFFGQAASM